MKKPSARETRGAILLAALTAFLLAVTLTQTSPSGDTLPTPAAGASAPPSSTAPADSICPICPISHIHPKTPKTPISPKSPSKKPRHGAAPSPRPRSPLDEPAH